MKHIPNSKIVIAQFSLRNNYKYEAFGNGTAKYYFFLYDDQYYRVSSIALGLPWILSREYKINPEPDRNVELAKRMWKYVVSHCDVKKCAPASGHLYNALEISLPSEFPSSRSPFLQFMFETLHIVSFGTTVEDRLSYWAEWRSTNVLIVERSKGIRTVYTPRVYAEAQTATRCRYVIILENGLFYILDETTKETKSSNSKFIDFGGCTLSPLP
jgi:hypothetical protein